MPLLVIAVALFLFYHFHLYHYLSFSSLSSHHQSLAVWTKAHYLLAVLIFMLTYAVVTAICLPAGPVILTLTGGFLFGILSGVFYIDISATVGAFLLFLAIKTSLGEWISKSSKAWISRLEAGFQKNAFSYLLFLRLVPLFPFQVVNVVSALLGVKKGTFFWATLIGIIPGSLVYAAIGNGLGSVFAMGQSPDFNVIFKPALLIPIIGLGLLSVVPILYKKLKSNRYSPAPNE